MKNVLDGGTGRSVSYIDGKSIELEVCCIPSCHQEDHTTAHQSNGATTNQISYRLDYPTRWDEILCADDIKDLLKKNQYLAVINEYPQGRPGGKVITDFVVKNVFKFSI